MQSSSDLPQDAPAPHTKDAATSGAARGDQSGTHIDRRPGTAGLESPPKGSIRARGLAKTFGTNRALAALDLDVEPGSIVGLIGPNGSGKSTMMRCIIGLIRPDAGEVWVHGHRLKGDGVNVRKHLTYAPGEMGVYREMRGKQHLDWLLRGRDTQTKRRAATMASELGLPLERKLGSYSHGMKRQLIFSAAMAPQVPVRILDEITEGLDPSRRTQVTDVLSADSHNGTTVLLSSHHFGEVDRVCERILFMQTGSVLEDTQASIIHDRAARLMRLVWAQAAEANTFADTVPMDLVRSSRVNGSEVVLELTHKDPRPMLSHLERAGGQPPTQVHFGATSLQDLYRDLYGVEGT